MKNITILSGAGTSAESGIATFRDSNGLWENHAVEDVASPEGFRRDPRLVLDFYNQRRAQLHEVEPNRAHLLIAELERDYNVTVVTQNIDDLHERAGSTNIIHLHGELFKARAVGTFGPATEWKGDIKIGDVDEQGQQMRPHIVWFGEDVPEIPRAADAVSRSHLVIIIGTSMQVYPAAGLVGYANPDAPIIYIDPKPTINHELSRRKIITIEKVGSEGMAEALALIPTLI